MNIGRYRLINTNTTQVVDEPATVVEKIAHQKQKASFTVAFIIIIYWLTFEPVRIYVVWLQTGVIEVDQNWSATLQNALFAAIGLLFSKIEEQPPVYAPPLPPKENP